MFGREGLEAGGELLACVLGIRGLERQSLVKMWVATKRLSDLSVLERYTFVEHCWTSL